MEDHTNNTVIHVNIISIVFIILKLERVVGFEPTIITYLEGRCYGPLSDTRNLSIKMGLKTTMPHPFLIQYNLSAVNYTYLIDNIKQWLSTTKSITWFTEFARYPTIECLV